MPGTELSGEERAKAIVRVAISPTGGAVVFPTEKVLMVEGGYGEAAL